MTNTVSVDGMPFNGDNVTDSNDLNVTVCNANVSSIKVDQTFALASQGGIVTYRLNITNTGNVNSSTVKVTDVLDPRLDFSATNDSTNLINVDSQTACGLT